MAAETMGGSTPNGWFKTHYADSYEVAIPEHILLQRLIPFNKMKAGLGKDFRFPLFLRDGYAATFNGDTTTGDVFTIATPTATVMKEAVVVGTEFADRMQMSYGAIASAQEKGPEAFGNFMSEWTERLTSRDRTMLEANFLYGGDDIGQVSSNDYTAGTTCTLTLDAEHWAAGLMAGAEGYLVDVWDDDWDPQRNTNGAITITSVDPDAKTIAVSATAAGDLSGIVAGDRIVPRGARKSTTANNWFYGVHAHLTNTGSLHGISASTYTTYKSSLYNNSDNPLSMKAIAKLAGKIFVKGGAMDEIDCFVSTASWTDLVNDYAGLRQFQEDTKSEMALGTNKLTFYGAISQINVRHHAMVKEGFAYMFRPKDFVRVGACDLSFKLPGAEGLAADFVHQLADQTGVELRTYSLQGLVNKTPCKAGYIYNIQNRS